MMVATVSLSSVTLKHCLTLKCRENYLQVKTTLKQGEVHNISYYLRPSRPPFCESNTGLRTF